MSLQLMIPRACVFLPDIHSRKVCLFHFNKGVNLLVAVPSPQRFTWGGGGEAGNMSCLSKIQTLWLYFPNENAYGQFTSQRNYDESLSNLSTSLTTLKRCEGN